MTEILQNFGTTTLAEDLDDSETGIDVTDGSVFPSTGNFRVNCEDELMLVTARAANTLTVTRGAEGTTATTHGSGTQIKMVLTAASLDTWLTEETRSLHIDMDVSGAHAIDLSTGMTHDLTLTGDSTFTFTGDVSGLANDMRLILRQDGTGGWEVTWPASVDWGSGTAPVLQTDPYAVDVIGLVTVDDGTTWLGFHAGSSGTPATTVETETTFGISSAVGSDTAYARQDHTHGTPSDPVTEAAIRDIGHWEVIVSGSAPPVAVTNEAEDDWLYGWTGG